MCVSVVYQKRLRRERKARKRVQDQLEQELKRRAQLEEMIKAAGAPADALRVLTGTHIYHTRISKQKKKDRTRDIPFDVFENYDVLMNGRKSADDFTTKSRYNNASCSISENNNEKPRDRSEQSQSPNYSSGQPQRGSETSNDKQWNYSGLDLMSSSGAAAFWQNYSGKYECVIRRSQIHAGPELE